MSRSHVTTDEAFMEQCFLWERGASVGADLNLKTFYMHKNEKKKQLL